MVAISDTLTSEEIKQRNEEAYSEYAFERIAEGREPVSREVWDEMI